MSRNRDPFDDFFGGDFFDVFDQMHREMEEIFGISFEDDFPTFHHPSMGSHRISDKRRSNGHSGPDLSLINPNVSSDDITPESSDKRNKRPLDHVTISQRFPHFYEPEYNNTPHLEDINPDLKTYDQNDKINNNSGILSPNDRKDERRSKMRSPYFPMWNGAERDIPVKSYYESTVITTDSSGNTKKVTTIHDESGKHTKEEVFGPNERGNMNEISSFDLSDFFRGFPLGRHKSIEDKPSLSDIRNYGNTNDDKDRTSLKLWERTSDPFGKWRHKLDKTFERLNPLNWARMRRDKDENSTNIQYRENPQNPRKWRNDWFWGNKSDKDNSDE